MATSLSAKRLRLAGLVECTLPCVLPSQARRLYVTSEIDDLLTGRLAATPEFPSKEADFDIGKFVRGYIVGVSRSKQGSAELKWLTGVPEAWVYCFRRPRPGWRLFGRFAAKNVFVGLHCVPREAAGDLVDYANAAREMIAKWDNLFPGEAPFVGQSFEDYLGEMVVER